MSREWIGRRVWCLALNHIDRLAPLLSTLWFRSSRRLNSQKVCLWSRVLVSAFPT